MVQPVGNGDQSHDQSRAPLSLQLPGAGWRNTSPTSQPQFHFNERLEKEKVTYEIIRTVLGQTNRNWSDFYPDLYVTRAPQLCAVAPDTGDVDCRLVLPGLPVVLCPGEVGHFEVTGM